MSIKIYTTGGTIDKVYFDQKGAYHIGDPQADNLLKRSNVVVDYECIELLRKDSLEMNEDDRALIRNAIEADEAQQIIITHGTDTMIDTANSLKSVTDKTIVLTGSMFPALYRDSDAVFNLGCALIGVQTLEHGVYIAMNGRIFTPENAIKNVDLNRFEQPNA